MEAKNKSRVDISVLALSAAGFLGIVASEGYTDKAVIPTKGDEAASFEADDGVGVDSARSTDQPRT